MLRRTPAVRRSPARFALALGTAGLLLTACDGAPSGPDLPLEPVGAVKGQLHRVGEGGFADLRARVTWGDQVETAPVEDDGNFSVDLFAEVSGFGVLTIEPGPASDLHPAYVLLSPGDVGGTGRIVMLPQRWTLPSGAYAGTVVPIDPEMAADGRVMPSFWGFFFPFRQEGFLQIVTNSFTWAGDLRTWPEDVFPIPVALDRAASTAPVSAADSVAFWTHVATMEEALGRDVFRPAAVEDVQILGGFRRARNAVLVQIDTLQSVDGYGDPNTPDAWTWLFAADGGVWSGTHIERVELGSADMNGARILLKSAALLSDRRTVIHELMHVLGAGHGCSWASVQTYCASLATDIPTAADVAHLEVLEAARRTEIQVRSRWGIMAAVMGHRSVTLGLTPVPRVGVVYGPASAPGSGG